MLLLHKCVCDVEVKHDTCTYVLARAIKKAHTSLKYAPQNISDLFYICDFKYLYRAVMLKTRLKLINNILKLPDMPNIVKLDC